MDFNRTILAGHVVHAPKSRRLPSGDTVARFSLATNSVSLAPRTKETAPGVDYHEITAFGRLADIVLKYVRGGKRLLVEGRLHNREYVGKNGVKVKTTEIVASQIVLLDSKRAKDDSARDVSPSEVAG